MRLVSWNIQGGLGMDKIRSLDRTAQVLNGLTPDLLCLQEVHCRFPQSGLQNQPARLRRLLGMPIHFHACFRVGISSFGNLLATPFPLRTVKFHTLTNSLERRRPALRLERRGLLEAVIELPRGPIAVFVTHWGLEEVDRRINAQETARRIEEVELPVLLMGDFNALPDREEVRLLVELSGLIDAGAAAKEATYPADIPRSRIDYLFHSPEIVVQQLTVVDTQVSDHRPLLAVL